MLYPLFQAAPLGAGALNIVLYTYLEDVRFLLTFLFIIGLAFLAYSLGRVVRHLVARQIQRDFHVARPSAASRTAVPSATLLPISHSAARLARTLRTATSDSGWSVPVWGLAERAPARGAAPAGLARGLPRTLLALYGAALALSAAFIARAGFAGPLEWPLLVPVTGALIAAVPCALGLSLRVHDAVFVGQTLKTCIPMCDYSFAYVHECDVVVIDYSTCPHGVQKNVYVPLSSKLYIFIVDSPEQLQQLQATFVDTNLTVLTTALVSLGEEDFYQRVQADYSCSKLYAVQTDVAEDVLCLVRQFQHRRRPVCYVCRLNDCPLYSDVIKAAHVVLPVAELLTVEGEDCFTAPPNAASLLRPREFSAIDIIQYFSRCDASSAGALTLTALHLSLVLPRFALACLAGFVEFPFAYRFWGYIWVDLLVAASALGVSLGGPDMGAKAAKKRHTVWAILHWSLGYGGIIFTCSVVYTLFVAFYVQGFSLTAMLGSMGYLLKEWPFQNFTSKEISDILSNVEYAVFHCFCCHTLLNLLLSRVRYETLVTAKQESTHIAAAMTGCALCSLAMVYLPGVKMILNKYSTNLPFLLLLPCTPWLFLHVLVDEAVKYVIRRTAPSDWVHKSLQWY